MNVVRFSIAAILTILIIFFLNNSWNIPGAGPVPPLGKFLDPYHGFWQNIEKTDHRPAKEFRLGGLKAPVTISFDSLLIPHIFAGNDDDLYFAQGYITAMHRLWQMEFQTHAAAGRVSEIIAGEPIVNYDRRQRRLGMIYGAENVLALLEEDDKTKNAVHMYTSGVNEYIKTLDYAQLPFEYKLLDYEPEQWTPLKCALLFMNMAQTLNIGDKDMEMTNALKLFGKEYVDLLYPDHEGVGDPIVEEPGSWIFNAVNLDSIEPALPAELITADKAPEADPTIGSNNWAVAGSKTATGQPLLCNDPHLTLSLPSIWYVVQLNAPGVNVMGASLPGAPCVIIGYNDSIAWGVTNAQRDLVDWYRITYENEKREKYKLGDSLVNTTKVVERIRVRGQADVSDTVIYTQWGPVTYDKNFRAESNHSDYAFRWIAHDRSNPIRTFQDLNRAKDHGDYMKALDHFMSPAQNFVFASVSGDIAIRVQGKFPVRRMNEGKFVLDGSNPQNGWQAFIPNEQNIAQKNPVRGFVSSANQYPVDRSYPYYITSKSYEAYRNRRINQVLAAKNDLTREDMMRLQNDNYNLKAGESLPYFLASLDTSKFNADEKEAYRIMKSWDHFNESSALGASYYEAWWDWLMPLAWDEMKNENALLSLPTTYNTIRLLKENPDLSFFDIVGTTEKETSRELLQKSFSESVKSIREWRSLRGSHPEWASYKDSFIGHLLPPMRALSVPVKTGGNHDIVNAHSRTHGPSWRMIVSLEKDGMKTLATYPGGQSGNPGSAFYSNLLDRWEKGEYHEMIFMKDPNAKNVFTTTTLNPN